MGWKCYKRDYHTPVPTWKTVKKDNYGFELKRSSLSLRVAASKYCGHTVSTVRVYDFAVDNFLLTKSRNHFLTHRLFPVHFTSHLYFLTASPFKIASVNHLLPLLFNSLSIRAGGGKVPDRFKITKIARWHIFPFIIFSPPPLTPRSRFPLSLSSFLFFPCLIVPVFVSCPRSVTGFSLFSSPLPSTHTGCRFDFLNFSDHKDSPSFPAFSPT